MFCGTFSIELTCFEKEVFFLCQYIEKINVHIFCKKKVKTASLLERICEVQETKFLEIMVDFAIQAGVLDAECPVVSLQHDGSMLLKSSKLNQQCLNDLQNHIFDQTGFRMNYPYKQMNEGCVYQMKYQ